MFDNNPYVIKDVNAIILIDFSRYKYFNNLFTMLEHSDLAEYVDTRNAILLINTFIRLKECNKLFRWNTSNVKSMKSCFSFCTYIDSYEGIKNWNVSNVISLERTFERNTSIKSFNMLRFWNLSNLQILSYTFANCISLIDLEGISNWNVNKVTNFSYAFANCKSLKSLKGLENWKVNKDANFIGMFAMCSELIDCSAIDNWNLNKNYKYIFDKCDKIERYPIWYDKNNEINDSFKSDLSIPEENDYMNEKEKYYKDNAIETYKAIPRTFAQYFN